MRKSKSSFGRLKNGCLYPRHPADAGGAFADVHIEKRPAKVHQSRTNSLCPLPALWDASFAIPSGCSLWQKIYSCLKVFVAETGSIKIERLCKTNPISEMPEMIVTVVYTMTNNNEPGTMNYPKQTQSNPTCGEQSRTTRGEPACTELCRSVEPLVVSLPALSFVEVSNPPNPERRVTSDERRIHDAFAQALSLRCLCSAFCRVLSR